MIVTDYTPLYTTGKEILQTYKDKLEELNIIAEGKLKGSADYNFKLENDRVVLQFILEDYWNAVEYGRGATKVGNYPPMLQPKIERWIAVKGIQPREIGMSQKQLSYAITKAIHKGKSQHSYPRGQQPLHKAIEEAEQKGLINKLKGDLTEIYHQQITVELEDLSTKKGVKAGR